MAPSGGEERRCGHADTEEYHPSKPQSGVEDEAYTLRHS